MSAHFSTVPHKGQRGKRMNITVTFPCDECEFADSDGICWVDDCQYSYLPCDKAREVEQDGE